MTLASVSSSNYLERLRPLSLIHHSMRRVPSSYAPSNSRGLSNGYLRRNVKAAEQSASADRLRRPLSAGVRPHPEDRIVSVDIERLREAYFIRGYDADFATGRRSHLVYALPSLRLSYTHLNPGGPEPLTYLEY